MNNRTDTAATSTRLRTLADLIDQNPNIPRPYITSYSSGTMDAFWYLHINGGEKDLPAQKATAAAIVSTLGGKWDKKESGEDFCFAQQRDDGIRVEVTVARAAVCKRIVTGSHEVTVPAIPAAPAMPASAERVETVEDVEWICSSLLAVESVAS